MGVDVFLVMEMNLDGGGSNGIGRGIHGNERTA